MTPHHHETNPHFLHPQQPLLQVPQPHLQHGPDLQVPPRQSRPHRNQNPRPHLSPISQLLPTEQAPDHHTRDPRPQRSPTYHTPLEQSPPHKTRLPEPEHGRNRPILPTQDQARVLQPYHDGPDSHFPLPAQLPSTRPVQPYHQSSNLRIPQRHKTRAHTWLIGAVCALFWVSVIMGGLIVLVVYIIFRPRSPKFDLASVTLNAVYLDMGYLLNADMTLLANFTNPSKKATVDFSYMVIDLYYEKRRIATSYVEPFSETKAESKFRNVHLVSSQVRLSLSQSRKLQEQIENNRVRFEVKGVLRTRSNLGSFFRYKYWLYGYCIIEVTGPPSGVLVGKTCTTKR